jgi:hypothetical protein
MNGDWGEARVALAAVNRLRALDGERTQLLPPEALLAEALGLALRGAADEEWQGVARLSEGLPGATECIEVDEIRAHQARRAGDEGRARHFLERALDLCPRTGMERDRISAALAQLALTVAGGRAQGPT